MHSGQLYFITEQFFKRVVDNDIKYDILTIMEGNKKVCKLLRNIFKNPKVIKLKILTGYLEHLDMNPDNHGKGAVIILTEKKEACQ